MAEDCLDCARHVRRISRERAAREEAEVIAERVSLLATRDPLTGLANRPRLLDQLATALERSEWRAGHVGVLFLDLDDFKAVNDSLGHAAGDLLLQEVARRLELTRRPGDIVARLGGDEFVVVCELVEDAAHLSAIAAMITDVLCEPYALAGTGVILRVSIGARLGSHTDHADNVLRDADTALSDVKRSGKAQARVFDEQIRTHALTSLSLEIDLRAALDGGSIVAWYQPIIDLETGLNAGAEALARWEHPTRGHVAPEEFVALAERARLIASLTRQMITAACRQAVQWNFHRSPNQQMNVNISAQDLEDHALVSTVQTALADSGLPATNLCLEVTERHLVSQSSDVTSNLTRLRSLGVEIAIDDFGVEYASFSALRQLPVTVLKIDRSFICSLGRPDRRGVEDLAIVEAMSAMSTALGLRTVAEGVETREQATLLAAIGIDHAQGWYFARAAPPAAWAPAPHSIPPPRIPLRLPTSGKPSGI